MASQSADSHVDVRRALEEFGFTEIEAMVYAALVETPGQTGYGLSKIVGKGQPSIYAALTGLERKSAVIGQGEGARTFNAVPPAELLDLLQQQFFGKRSRAERALAALTPGQRAAVVETIDTAEKVYAKARALIQSAEETLLFELFPQPLDVLRSDLAAAAAQPQGCAIAGMVLRETAPIDGTTLVTSPVGARVIALYPNQLAHIVADGRRALLAGIAEDGSARALWTDDGFLSTVLHNALTSDILTHRAASPDWIGPNLELFGRHPPGLRDLLQRP